MTLGSDSRTDGDRYKIEERLVERPTTVVYRAHDLALNRLVALKCARPGLIAQKPQYRDLLAREARHLARLDHPNIIPFYEFCEGRDGPVLVMRFVGGTLEQLREEVGSGLIRGADRIAVDVASALDYCASQGLSHRDVKPDNLLLGSWGDVYLADFGIAAPLDDSHRWAHPEGTKAFLSPEMLMDSYFGARAERRRSADQFSFGVTLYYLLTASLPHEPTGLPVSTAGSDWSDCTAYRILRGQPIAPCSDRDPTIPSAVDAVLSRMLSVDPDDRYGSNLAAATALGDALSGRTGDEPSVFASYARADGGAVQKYIDGLDRAGFKMFWDRKIEYGTDWEDRIEEAMADSDVMLVLLSPKSAASPEVKNEWRYWTGHLKKPLITVILDDCQVPYRLFSRQHIQAQGRSFPDVFAQVASALRKASMSSRPQSSSERSRDKKQHPPVGHTYASLGALTIMDLASSSSDPDSAYVPARYRFTTLPADVASLAHELKLLR